MQTLSARTLIPGFLLGIILGLGLVWWATFFQLGVPNPNSLNYRDLIHFKKEAARKVVGPKMLICAGSSSLLGLRADLMTKALGITTINMGVGAALGIPTSCRWAQELAKPGDTVLLVFEYNLYDWNDLVLGDMDQAVSSVRYNSIYVDYLLAYDSDWFRQMPWIDQAKVVVNVSNKRLLDGLARKLQSYRHPQLPGQFSRPENLDEYGDDLYATNANRPVHTGLEDVVFPLVKGLPENPAGFRYLTTFIQWCRDHQIRVLASWPNLLFRAEYLQPTAQLTVERIRNYYTSQGVPVIGRYEDVLLPREQFYDTIYHLIVPAAVERTNRLLAVWPRDKASAIP